MSKSSGYAIRDGVEGRERLRVLARVMGDSSKALLDRLDLRDGLACLDAGCGGGDVTLELARRVAPSGRVVGVDADRTTLEIARGHFTHPDSPSQRRYEDLYCELVRRRGGDPNIGPRLPSLLRSAGFTAIGVAVVQPVALVGEAKLMTPITMENIADAVLQEGLATRPEVDEIIRGLYDFATDPETLSGVPRIVQAWGRRECSGE